MRISIKKYWILINSLIIIAAIGLTLFFSNAYLKMKFRDYHEMSRKKEINIILEEIGMQYESHNQWNKDNLKKIAIRALTEGYVVDIKEDCGRVLWDEKSYGDGECKIILEEISNTLNKTFDTRADVEAPEDYFIENDGVVVGKVEVSNIKGFGYGNNELWFLNNLNRAIIIIGVLLLLLFGGIVYWFGNRTSKNLKGVSDAARDISKGNFEAKVNSKSVILEVQTINEAVNNMSSALKEHEEIQKRITSDVAHELRTPLTTLQSHVEAMIDGIWEPSESRLEVCHKEIMRLKKLVDDSWKLTKFESESTLINREVTDISDLMESIRKSRGHISGEEWSVEEEIHGKIDRDKLYQAVLNLIDNAHKYGRGEVQINLKEEGDSFYISVKDNGEGIEEKHKKHIFERFYRGDESRSEKRGAGIGLTIVKKAVEINNGEIYFKSDNEGTEFIMKYNKSS